MSDTKTIIDTQVNSPNTYDQTPYESYPYSHTRPENLKAIAHIFGLETPALETARILELGCAAGGNIMNHAIHYPNAKFVGVDLSKVQVDIGNKQIAALGLKNIELKAISITDITKSFGEFDYIICHGVLSWVPENVREAIFRISNENLSKNGIAYISYNTLPGWNMVRTVRDMMMFHSHNFADINEKVQQSRLLLDFVKDSLEGSNSPYGEIMNSEAKLLSTQPDHYLRHDHMEDINHQYYFHEFMKKASENGLQYLGDAALATMYAGNLPKQISDKLAEVKEIVRAEQYMDFVTNRRFRSTILCKSNVQLTRNITGNSIADLYFSMRVSPSKPLNEVVLDNNDNLDFYYAGIKENKLSANTPILKALLYILHESTNFALNAKDLVAKIKEMLPQNKYNDNQIMSEIISNITRLVFCGYITVTANSPTFVRKVSEMPKLSPLARVQLESKQNWVTNEVHDKIAMSDLDLYIMRYLDGKHNKAQIVDKLVNHTAAGELQLHKDNKLITDPSEREQIIKTYLDQALNAYASNALLVA